MRGLDALWSPGCQQLPGCCSLDADSLHALSQKEKISRMPKINKLLCPFQDFPCKSLGGLTEHCRC